MNNIKFTCPQCGQHLTVDASCADATVACPLCGQAIIVPQLARIVATPEKPKQSKWALGATGIAVVVLLAAGVLVWQIHRQPAIPAEPTSVSKSVASKTGAATQDSMSANAEGEESPSTIPVAHDTLAVPNTVSPPPTKNETTLPAAQRLETDLSDWFVVLDDSTNGFYASPGVPQAAIAALDRTQQRDAEIKSFSFTPAGDWVLLDNNGFETSDEDVPAYQHLNRNTKYVTFSPSGPWIILYRGNGFWGPGSAAWLKVQELLESGHEVRSVSFGSGNGFVVLYNETGVSYGGIPPDLAKVLDHAASNNIAIQCVAFSGQDWICLAHDGWWTSNTNLPASKIIDQEFKVGWHPKWVALVPTLGPFNAAKFGAIIRQTMSGKLVGGYECEAIDHGKVVVTLAEGWARAPWEKVDPAVKMTINKPMELASVSKTITSVAILKLCEECAGTSRQFSLDEPFWPHISNICPNVNEGVKRITIRQVLMHRSGFIKNSYGRDLRGLRQLLLLPLAHQPGTSYLYQNINYSIIRFLIEQISQMDYTDYVKTHVLDPMGITDMETHSEYQQRTCYYGHLGAQVSGEAGFRNLSSTAGSYGWYGSAAELGKFLEGIRQCTVISPATTAMMLKENLGWDSGNPWIKGGLDSWSHGHVHSVIAYFPDGVEAVVLFNCDRPEPANPFLVQAWEDAHGN